MATFSELVRQIKVIIASTRDQPPPGLVVKEMLRHAKELAEPPPTAEEFVQAMRELGLRPGWD